MSELIKFMDIFIIYIYYVQSVVGGTVIYMKTGEIMMTHWYGASNKTPY